MATSTTPEASRLATPKQATEPAVTDPPLTSTAADLLSALRTVMKRLERTPVPAADAATEAKWRDAPPAPRHIAALMQIVSDEGISVSVLASRLGVSLATASQVVTDLESGGLIQRVEDPADRRRTLVTVTETHRALAQTILDTRLRPVQRALDQMKPAEQRAVIRGLQLIAEELETSES
ncbi:MAG TPA: MarR family transcriptional regulator [Mycobacteriales bacterium]|nr:MarR family transcriptional regulator [Mycobacteriales bacterium]